MNKMLIAAAAAVAMMGAVTAHADDTTVIYEPPPLAEVDTINFGAGADATATRGTAVQVEPTAPEPVPTGLHGLPFAPPGLSNCDEMTFYRVQAGLPARFDAIGWRESNCRNEDGVHTSCCWGYWQIHRMHMGGKFGEVCGAWSVNDINSDNPLDKQRQACSAKLLYDMAGLSPWAATR